MLLLTFEAEKVIDCDARNHLPNVTLFIYYYVEHNHDKRVTWQHNTDCRLPKILRVSVSVQMSSNIDVGFESRSTSRPTL